MSALLYLLSLTHSVVPASPPPQADQDPCWVVGAASSAPERRALTLDDQVELVDIGRSSTTPAPVPFAISHDGRRIAILTKQASATTNAYCYKLLVKPVFGDGKVQEVARGGDFIPDTFSLRKFAAIYAGWDKPNVPRWSPDGRWIAYLRRENGTTQVWIADPDGRIPARQLTELKDEPDIVGWMPDSAGLIVSSRSGLSDATEAIALEGLQGFHFDDRFSPQFADRPIPSGALEETHMLVELSGGAHRPARAEELAVVASGEHPGLPDKVRLFRKGAGDKSAWLEEKSPELLLSPTQIVMSGPSGRAVCRSRSCEGVRDLWWSERGNALYLLQTGGWARSETRLLRWDVGDREPRSILQTSDVLLGCTPLGSQLICARESATQPRRLVALDMRDGHERIVFDPNPHLKGIRFGKVERMRFRNTYGVESFADLVLPPDHRDGQRHPLVVVQYSSMGFLRGGTGDEVPVHPLTARGFAVLSFDRPDFLPEVYRATSEAELRTLNPDPWADRRQVLSSLETAIDLAIGTGSVDPERIGISGLSDGSSTAQFALVNSRRFKAASIGSCCEDKYAFALAAGPNFTDYLRAMGYSYFEPSGEDFWSPMSLIQNAAQISTPILIQASDSEYEGGLDVVEAFSNRGNPIDMFVFPGEAHFKWQPAHRQAMYRRNLEWFEFWLKGRKNCDPAKSRQFEIWEAMRDAPRASELQCAQASSGMP